MAHDECEEGIPPELTIRLKSHRFSLYLRGKGVIVNQSQACICDNELISSSIEPCKKQTLRWLQKGDRLQSWSFSDHERGLSDGGHSCFIDGTLDSQHSLV